MLNEIVMSLGDRSNTCEEGHSLFFYSKHMQIGFYLLNGHSAPQALICCILHTLNVLST